MDEQPASLSKALPPDLTLHAAPTPVTRFNRRVVTVILGGAGLAVFGALFYGLALHHGGRAPGSELYTNNVPVSDRLNSLPSTYSDLPKPKSELPKLGAPLPGDLGRPMLKIAGRNPLPQNNEDQAERAAREALAREADRARTAKVFFGAGAGNGLGAGFATTPVAALLPASARGGANPPVPPLDAASALNQQDRKLAFLHQAPDQPITSLQRLHYAASPYVVSAGSIIRAALLTAVNSDLPGLAEAQVTENVCDSVTGHTLLIPQGSRLIGEVDSQISYGQERLLAAWTQIKFPDGSTLVLDRLPGADTAGASGFDADIDYHTWRLIKGVVLSSLLGISTELAASNGTENNDRIIVATRDSANDSINQAGQRITEREVAIQPTLTQAAGYPFAVLISKDLILQPRGPC